ncbi:glycosyltransferase family 2 protein [Cohnella kolymensis]|uniref:glycosyltransferase family 2 protein n=1 Tax=Cohnella kolymensis TaxID=1590652 RepID=UPI0009E4C21B|nr:glycosyltransferase family 2 protein [Cohnella kolymensis]
MTKASIIIPTYNRLGLLQNCIASIREHTNTSHEIIVVDRASSDGTADWCRREKLPIISLPRNEGFSVACNKGLLLSSGDTLVLLHSDTVVSPNWLNNLQEALYSSSDIGIVAPVLNRAGDSQKVHYPFENIEEFQRIAAEVNISDPEKWKRVETFLGVCVAFQRALMEKLGLLDERLSGAEQAEEDYSIRSRRLGLSLLVCQDTFIFHDYSEK